MTTLRSTEIQHDTSGQMDIVGFDTDDGAVDLTRFEDGEAMLEVDFEDVGPEAVADILDDMASEDAFPEEALETAWRIVEDARDQTDTDENEDEAEGMDTSDDSDTSDDHGTVVHELDDGTNVRVGDRINHPGGWSYKITGRDGEHTLTKMDPTDDWGVVVSTVEKDIREHGFSERVEADE